MAQSLSNLALGAKVKFGRYSVKGEVAQPIIWVVVAKNHYSNGSVTLFSDKVLDILQYDAPEPTNSDSYAKTYGNAIYRFSNVDQWLNSDGEANTWYSPQSSTDTPPSYASRPGFLNAFYEVEKNALLDATVSPVSSPTVTYVTQITRKVLLPSHTELGRAPSNTFADGVKWAGLDTVSLPGYLTPQAFEYSESGSKPDSIGNGVQWWMRSLRLDSQTSVVYTMSADGSYTNVGTSAKEECGIRPFVNLSSTVPVSDVTDEDGCYAVRLNTAPTVPSALNLPTNLYGGRANTITWSPSADVDGDIVTYELECAYDGGDFTSVYLGVGTSYAHAIPLGETSVQYRVRAVDSEGAGSGYTTSLVVGVINNNPPEISGTDGNLGTATEGFTREYSVTDADGDNVTVTEAIDGVVVRTHVVTLGESNTFAVTDTTWVKLSNGSHTMTITASDINVERAVRTYTFVKNVTSCSVQTSPMRASAMPTLVWVSVTRSVPTGAIFKVEVCNNGYDAEPTWEDATADVMESLAYQFVNDSKTADNWAVALRVTLDRNGASGACYISQIGGNFE